jgi:hypothetical protein
MELGMMGPTGIPGAAASFDPRQPPSPPQRIDREAPDAFGIIAGPCPLHGPQSDHDHGLKIINLAEVSKRTNILSSRNLGVRD